MKHSVSIKKICGTQKIKQNCVMFLFAFTLSGCGGLTQRQQSLVQQLSSSQVTSDDTLVACGAARIRFETEANIIEGACLFDSIRYAFFSTDPTTNAQRLIFQGNLQPIKSFGVMKTIYGRLNPALPNIMQVQLRAESYTVIFNMTEDSASVVSDRFRLFGIPEIEPVRVIGPITQGGSGTVYIPPIVPRR